MKDKIKIYDNKKGSQKIQALTMWKEGQKISAIAKELKKARSTIYQWIRSSPEKLSKPGVRRRLQIDAITRSRIIELYIVLGRPSMRELREKLDSVFMIKKSETQLRLFIKRMGLDIFRPSLTFETLLKWKISDLTRSKDSSGGAVDGEIFQ